MTLGAYHLNWTHSEGWLSSFKGLQYFLVFFLPFWVPNNAQPPPLFPMSSNLPRSLAPLLVTMAWCGSKTAPATARLGRSTHTACSWASAAPSANETCGGGWGQGIIWNCAWEIQSWSEQRGFLLWNFPYQLSEALCPTQQCFFSL